MYVLLIDDSGNTHSTWKEHSKHPTNIEAYRAAIKHYALNSVQVNRQEKILQSLDSLESYRKTGSCFGCFGGIYITANLSKKYHDYDFTEKKVRYAVREL